MGVKTIFELEDRISKRLKRINGELGHTEKIRKRIEKPMIISAEDRASRQMKRIERFFLRKAVKAHNINVGLHDRATKGMQRMNRYLKRNMPRSHEITMRAVDRLTPMASSLKRNLQRKFGKQYEYVIQAKDQVSTTVRKVASFTRKQLERGYTVSLRAVDLISRTVGRISSYARSSLRDHSMRVRAVDLFTGTARRISHFANTHLNRTVTMTIKVADLATKPIRAIAGFASSTGAMLGVGAGAYGGVVKPLQMVAGRQNMTSAFETLLGDAEKAQERLDDLVTFAGQTPFKRDDIFEASRVLQVFTGDALSTADGLRLVGDVAAGTQTDFGETAMWFGRMYDAMASGRPIGDATARLQEMGAISGEARARLEDLAESGRDISSIWPEATKEFERFNGQMEKMSNNLSNLWLGVTSMINERILFAWGSGMSDAFQPMLERFREWRGEYSFILDEMQNFFNRSGKAAAASFLGPLQSIGSFANEQLQILFPGGDLTEDQQVKLKEKFEQDPEFEKRYNQLEQYRDMDFQARWNIVWPNIQQEFMEWWRDTGAPGIVAGAESVGGIYGNVTGGLIRGILGVEDESGNEFIDTGALAGRSFVEGFLEAIDPVDLSGKLTKKWASTNVDFLTGNGDFGSFLLNNLLAGLLVSKIAKPLKSLGKGAGKLKDGALWGYNTISGRNSKNGRNGPPNGPTGSGWFGRETKTEKAQRRSEEARAKKTAERAAQPSYNERMKQMSRELYPPTQAADQASKRKWPKLPSFPGMSTTKSSTLGGGWGNAGRRIPLLGTALGGASIAAAPEGEKASAAGGVLGGMAGGAATGALVGSVFPGVGTIVGGILGGIAGSIGGSKLGQYLQDIGVIDSIKDTIFNGSWWSEKWDSTVEGTKALYKDSWMQKTVDAIGNTVFSGQWWSDKWNSITEGTSSLYEGSWIDKSIDAIGSTLFSGDWWSDQWNKAVEGATSLYEDSWLDKAVSSIGNTLFNGEWWSNQWGEITEYASKLADPAWWANQAGELYGLLETTLFSGDWWSAKWEEVTQYSREFYEGSWLDKTVSAIGDTVFNGEWWGSQWDKTIDGAKKLYEGSWLDNTLTAINDSIFNGDWWSEKWDKVQEWSLEKAIQIGGLGFKIKSGIDETVFNSEWWSERWDAVKEWGQSKWDSAVSIWDSVKDSIGETIFNGEWWGDKWDSVKDWSQAKLDSAQEVWDSVQTKLGNTLFSGDWWNHRWDLVKLWAQHKWDSAQDIWDSVQDKIDGTIFSGDWWSGKWDDVTDWSQEKWDSATDIWDSVQESITDSVFNKDWWGEKWGNVLDWGKGVLGSMGSWWDDNVATPFKEGRESGQSKGNASTAASKAKTSSNRAAVYGPPSKYANGGFINQPHLGLVGEAGPEAIIPLSANRRSRALDLYEQTGAALGVRPYANGGLVGGAVKSSGSHTANVQATVGIGQIQAKGIEKEAGLYGNAFSESVAAGINGTVVSMDAWKQKNVQQPMTSVVQEAVGFGSSTVNSFSSGQNATSTNTGTHLDKQVKQPFRVIEGGASKWGTDTVTNFRVGQNGTPTGTQPYLQSQVHKPFDDTKAKGNGWGTGTMTEFVSGMRSQSSQVEEAAQFLADTVEKTFKERLGIHSPSRVMFGLGEWTSLGILKGLDAVDLKKFANKQVDGLISAYTGMAPDFGSPFTMTSGFGPRKSPGGIGSTNHKGLDFAAPMGTPIPAQAPGQVTFSGWQGGYGNLIKIQGADGIEYLYGHNSKNLVKKGDLVSGGQTIGLVGSTGNSTGPHVHYETRRNGQAFNPMGGGNSLFGGSGTSTRSAIAQAALATGVGKDWIDPLMTIAMKESGGNARAVNNWDSNARRGTPSKGLMQTIDPTFNAHKLSGMDDIYNPVHNAAASIRYIQSRYGDISNVPGIRSMRNGGAYRGYANGGLITSEQIARIGEGGQREWIIPEERGIRGRYLLGRAAQALGMEVYDPEDDSAQSEFFKEHASIATGQHDKKVVTSSGGISITIEMNGDQHFHTTQDEDAFIQKMKKVLIEELEEDLRNGAGGAQGA